MKHTFIVSDENNVNEYGFRVMTDGIDTVQFMRNPVVYYIHDRGLSSPKGHEVIGRVTNLSKKDGQLIAEVEFDVEDKFAKRIEGKVARGFIRMASINADVIETSTDPEHTLPNQIFETVLTSKLIEISIVDIGGNDNALKLSKDGKRIKLKRLKSKPEIHSDMDMKSIALALDMGADSKPESVLQKVKELQLAKQQADDKANKLEEKLNEANKQEAETLTDKAVALGLISDGLKESQLKAFESDHEGQKAVLSRLIQEKEGSAQQQDRSKTVREVVLSGKGSGKSPNIELNYDYLQKNDPTELRRIRDEEPKKYAELAKGYAAGIRHKD
ncbi:hypothetical protein [Zunongwangia profunda]|uniref:hypothetical protein n=1 Tax=Zunongwangia profunda TaxID=398743 RepID=UPI00248E47E9|nr:hypothetical protein [Zunongwangia profunda]